MTRYFDRKTGLIQAEDVYFGSLLYFLYGNSWTYFLFGKPLLYLICHFSFASTLFGWWNRLPSTKKKILPFIKRYHIDSSEFARNIEDFESFNDFFIRKLNAKTRPIEQAKNRAIIPADGRYLVYPNIAKEGGFLIKGEKFKLLELIQNEQLANSYENGSMVIARLCPTDYHRYHFPVNCYIEETKTINGPLYSVNPLALKRNIHILTTNKRMLSILHSEEFGKVLFIEVGATNVGSINQTYQPFKNYQKGEEKGYFSFGASTLILLFEPNRIQFDADLICNSSKKLETLCLMGQPLGSINF